MTCYDVRIGICTNEGGINAVIDRELLRCLRRALKKEKEFLQENPVGIAWGRGKEGRHDRQKETCKETEAGDSGLVWELTHGA